MRKLFLLVFVLLIAGIAVYFLFWNKEDKPVAEDTLQPLSIEENTSAFNRSYNQLLAAYTEVKDALVAGDTAKASAAAQQLSRAADSLKVQEIQGDSTGVIKETARNFAGTISSSARGLAAEADIKAKRKEFEIVADAMWSLTRTVRYDGQKLYWQYCPMAFNNRGAYWMSTSRQIRNPYFGDEMLECGSVEDSVDYAKK